MPRPSNNPCLILCSYNSIAGIPVLPIVRYSLIQLRVFFCVAMLFPTSVEHKLWQRSCRLPSCLVCKALVGEGVLVDVVSFELHLVWPSWLYPHFCIRSLVGEGVLVDVVSFELHLIWPSWLYPHFCIRSLQRPTPETPQGEVTACKVLIEGALTNHLSCSCVVYNPGT